mmetsp:Transcript_14270/g.34651  ORF Transcript_14270/g.34651 Transcript_14270/m.34651 type:complete len:319 (-) Transcript_14270:82-1038(-)
MWNSVILPHPTAQLRGVVAVLYHGSADHHSGQELLFPDTNFIMTLMNAVASFPLRYSAMHICLKTETQDLVSLNSAAFKQAMDIIPRYTRVRTRAHFGSDAVLQKNLRRHGLSPESLPVDLDGIVRMKILNEWFFKHKANTLDTAQINTPGSPSDDSFSHAKRSSMHSLSESELDSSDFMHIFDDEKEGIRRAQLPSTTEGETHPKVLINQKMPGNPSPNDVLLGRGWRVQNHEGNVRFRNFLEGHCDAYDASPRLQKRLMVGNLVRLIQGKGVRFLKQVPSGEWIDSTHDDAENKVSQLFRTIRKNRQPQLKKRARK